MQLLLDTQIFLWFLSGEERLPAKASAIMASAEAIYVSAASLWEIAVKVRIGKLKADPEELVAKLTASGFHPLPVLPQHTLPVAQLPLHHADPFDRMLIAQAISEQIWLLTTDSQLPQYTELVLRV